ncbi:hypothetical protein COY43_02135 [Candidatus Berkelbacteria bacterium CG_4_10_14_0_8_um_filter_35_9_33_8]|uniref:Uncharacterized protein n=1 Tax=Candidatus Berkelbacteria bacterium CG_4_10_14_0_2_um_filter_35_9_33_12 TaxID=1974499 RepID=A0A2M7W430_9BACT|nr:MAG: hypothetical protein COX10_01945 [Candidatus Berkelbacteria bacterium CG23_combo_of_CG06-09_8_20_14_all_33_15]PIS08634.1 MAG: hypothetical protein COT76_00270 [Candidatus Berkelbacteria bacterium CG10_big_fil_rev_8_21_14_0_10_33_10]PIZ28136.1 MAG: hypothetical protein COY43_02135 [Candidatus Berkelbacteria bacterium CG_4_10_14_0_8_um_filter_35_9_33_8]PJA20419.1 MAG: hypothetical protein COX60_01790 [Candidatus Berkelbacteria bacterium CG_4_10_14_0_2_um_filter_35_9_33_12]PJB52165.1 MAG: 
MHIDIIALNQLIDLMQILNLKLFREFENLNLDIVSDLEIRASDFRIYQMRYVIIYSKIK